MIFTLECVGCYVSMATLFYETLHRMQHSVSVVILVLLVHWTTVLTDKLPIVYDQPIINLGPLDVLLDNCSGNAPFSEETFRLCLPPPPNFTLPPPPPFISGDCGDTYSWQLVRNSIASSVENNNGGDCTEQFVQRIVTPPETASTQSTSDSPPPTKRPNRTRNARLNDTDRGGEQVSGEENEKEIVNENDGIKEEVVKNRKTKINQKIPKVKTAKITPDLLSDVTTCANDESCNTKGKVDRKKPRKIRGLPGPPGPQGAIGPPGEPGAKGIDGLPGLVVFPDAAAMFGVSLEGLIAYRKDVKQLFVRDHLTWRPIRVAKCGDGIVDRDAGEQCDDGNDDIHDDCFGCRRSSCGDGIRNRRTEECDGRDFGDRTCTTYRDGLTGPLTCTPECQISYQRCRHKRYLRR